MVVNGVDVVGFVEAELDRRAPDPEGLRAAWVALEEEWEHHRFAVRDLDAIEAKSAAPGG